MLNILMKILPALLPLIIFAIWYVVNTRKDIKVVDDFEETKKRYMIRATIASCLIGICLMVFWGLSQEGNEARDIFENIDF